MGKMNVVASLLESQEKIKIQQKQLIHTHTHTHCGVHSLTIIGTHRRGGGRGRRAASGETNTKKTVRQNTT